MAARQGAQILGVHLEGPYFSVAQCGAQDPAHMRTPDDGSVDRYLEHHDITRIVSFAPELPGAIPFTRRLAQLGIVPAAGHTPGSVIVLVTLPSQRYAFVGDLAWQREGITEREERPWLMRSLADQDADAVRANLVAMNAIVTAYPQIALVPAHDARAFAGIPKL